MASHVYPTIPGEQPPAPDEDDNNGGFPRPEADKPDKDEQHLRVERMLGYVPQRPPRKWLRLLLIVVAVLAVIAGGYFALKNVHFTSKKAPAKTNDAPTAASTKPAPLKSYSSSNFNVSFSYPETWGVIDNGDGKLTVTSPVVQLKNANGKSVRARAVLTLQNKQTSLPNFSAGSAVAAIASQKISYTKPTPNQRAQTYLSFLNYASSKGNGIDGVYVTGDDGYQQGQAIPQSDVIQIDPLITATFTQCADQACSSGGAALTVASSEWSDSSFNTPILGIITSLAIQ